MDERNPDMPEDPSGIEEPHDVLAAEEFGIGTRDERIPSDPSGIQEPHDVLAAEEFAIPSAGEHHEAESRSLDARTWLPLLAFAALVGIVALRRRGR
jgi:hypothetical protein